MAKEIVGAVIGGLILLALTTYFETPLKAWIQSLPQLIEQPVSKPPQPPSQPQDVSVLPPKTTEPLPPPAQSLKPPPESERKHSSLTKTRLPKATRQNVSSILLDELFDRYMRHEDRVGVYQAAETLQIITENKLYRWGGTVRDIWDNVRGNPSDTVVELKVLGGYSKITYTLYAYLLLHEDADSLRKNQVITVICIIDRLDTDRMAVVLDECELSEAR